MSKILVLISLFPILLTTSESFGKAPKNMVRSVSKEEMLLLRKVDKKYQKAHGIHLTLKKTIVLGMLGTTKDSEGEIWLNDGKMRLQINKPEASKIVADKKYLWIESAPPEDFEGSSIQVMRASLTSDQAKAQGLIQLLTKGGVLKYFRVSGVQKVDKKITYFLQPDKTSMEFKRAKIVVDIGSAQIDRLIYWDQMDNETIYNFTKSEFNQKLDKKIFSYKPPKGAKVIIY